MYTLKLRINSLRYQEYKNTEQYHRSCGTSDLLCGRVHHVSVELDTRDEAEMAVTP
eukprot:m.12211 g.12211  ORF g.12211 m.12211 type:complete len:56 (-) comp5811_c0_seq1:255-422(-)